MKKTPLPGTARVILVAAIALFAQSAVSQDAANGQSLVEQPSTSSDPEAALTARSPSPAAVMNDVITFSEFPLGTFITSQYSNLGILFGGDNPFITTDGANPTSPALSGSPRFEGAIEGNFVSPDDSSKKVIVESFSLDAGYFDELGSTRLIWFDPDGAILGQRANSQFAIERFTVEGGNIASWRIEIFRDEPAGYAIDNFSSQPVRASVLFREKADSEKEGTWGFSGDEIPGFDHCALQVDDLVHESHPGYPAGTYVSEDGLQSRWILSINGVQAQHSKKTFAHDSTQVANSPVIDFEEIPISQQLAGQMRTKIDERITAGSTFRFINISTLDGIEETLSPSAQKGGDNSFTCVGLVEWAAEQAGHNGGQGFIKNDWESFEVNGREIPLLSPQLLNYTMKGANLLGGINQQFQSIKQWFQGLIDPVDFVITDPLGRRLGFTSATGELMEVPGAFYSGNGKFEQFFIPNPVAGSYSIWFVGVGSNSFAAFGDSQHANQVQDHFAPGQTHHTSFLINPYSGAPGDLDSDGDRDDDDLASLQSQLNQFVNDPNHPGDINRDGKLDNLDVGLLQALLTSDTDADNDGVLDSVDDCLNTPSGEIVNTHGCSISQLVPCAGPAAGQKWKNHGEYVSTVAHTTEQFLKDGLITNAQKDAIIAAAAMSACGR